MKKVLILSWTILLLIIGCKKETPITEITPPIVEEPEPTIEIDYEGVALDHTTFVTKLISQASMLVFTQPSLHGLVDTQADVRSCPDYTQTPAAGFGDASNPSTVSLDVMFSSCNPGAMFNNLYDGNINTVFTGALGTSGSSFTMNTTSLDVGSYNFMTASPITFTHTGAVGEYNYTYSLGGDVTVSDGTFTTTYPSGMTGTLGMVDQNGNDDSNNPFTFIDNKFQLGINSSTITCNNGTSNKDITINTTSPIAATPLSCGCPESGNLTLGTDTYDFGDGTCDNDVVKTESGGTMTTLTLASCGAAATCSDGIQNQGEGGVDCGGPCPTACPPSCTDGIQNQGETEIDCGGPNCTACPTCSDGIQNQGETGIDCGGPCTPCHCSDGVQNSGEAGVDCGGPCSGCPTIQINGAGCYPTSSPITVTISGNNGGSPQRNNYTGMIDAGSSFLPIRIIWNNNRWEIQSDQSSLFGSPPGFETDYINNGANSPNPPELGWEPDPSGFCGGNPGLQFN